MAYEIRDTATLDEMRAFQTMAAFDKDDYIRKLNAFKNGERSVEPPYIPGVDGAERVCMCVKEYVPSSTNAVHYACCESRQGTCKYGAYQDFSGECAFLAKMSLPGMMGHVIKSCTNWDAHAEADRADGISIPV